MKYFMCIILVIIILFNIIYVGCDETLPEYKEPPNILTGAIFSPVNSSTITFNVREFYRDPSGQPIVTFYGVDSMILRLEVENIYDTPIKDSTEIGGYIKIWDPIYPENIAYAPFSRNSLSPYTDYLTIDTGKTGKKFLKTGWKLKLQDGAYIWFGKRADDYPNNRVVYGPFILKAKAYIKLYKKLGLIVTKEIEFKLEIISTVVIPG